jgi:hypothetical protein
MEKKGKKQLKRKRTKETKTESESDLEYEHDLENGIYLLSSKYVNLDSHNNPDSKVVCLSVEKLKKSPLVEITDSEKLSCQIQKFVTFLQVSTTTGTFHRQSNTRSNRRNLVF